MRNKQELNWYWTAIALWVIPMGVIAIQVFLHPLSRSMTPIYHDAAAHWFAHQPVYSGSKGFNYLPVFLPFFGLFAQFPLTICEILWRWIALFGLGLGLWRCIGLLAPTNRNRAFAIVTILTLPICVSALRNGQSSALLAACLVLATWCLHKQRWWWATVWLCVSLVCKPLGIPAIGLAIMAFPRVWWRVTLGVFLVMLIPYLLAPTSYVNSLYAAFASNILDCFSPVGRTFADINGVLMPLNLKLEGMPSFIVRVLAGVAMAAGCLITRRLGADIMRALIWLGFTGIYIMLFTPMNEGNSYVMLAPSFGLWAWWDVENGRLPTAKIIGSMSATMVFLPDIVGMTLGKDYGNEFAKFLYPLFTLIFLGILILGMKIRFFEMSISNQATGLSVK